MTAPLSVPGREPSLPTGSRLRALAGRVWFGVRSDRSGPELDRTIVERECNAVQFTHYPAWGGWPKRGDYGLTRLTANIDHFSALGLPMVMHMFVGPDKYLPDWLKNGTWDTATLDQLLGELVTTTIQSGDPNSRVNVWNVVNEAVSWDGTGWEASKFLELGYEPDASGLTGSDRVFDTIPIYVRRAFEYARLGTSRELELRDYDTEGLETRWGQGERKMKAFHQLVRHLLAKGTPVDSVGIQGHFNIDVAVTWSRLTEQVERYRALGLKVYITELDAQQNDHSTAWDASIAERQGEYFYQYVKAALAGGVSGIFAWGVRDNQDQGWLLGENALLFNEDGSPKPAYYGVQRAFEEALGGRRGG
jgi:GH35 family endo-1,4-beta-xylanase